MQNDKDIKKWTDEEIIVLLRPDMDKATIIQDELGKQRKDYYARFRMDTYGNEREGFSKSVAPVIYNNHKWTIANLIDIFNEEFFMLKGDNEENAAKFQRLIYYQMFRK